jgi:hypothetical protein
MSGPANEPLVTGHLFLLDALARALDSNCCELSTALTKIIAQQANKAKEVADGELS